MTETPPHLKQLMLSPFYHHAVNSVTRPNKYVFCSQYFVERWMPLLGGVGTQIVLFLRRQGFHNRVTGELRDEIAIEVSDIAKGIGSAPRTVQYHLAENEALQQFVRKRERFEIDPRSRDGKRRQCENGFQIAMDDPVHQDDLADVEAYIREQQGAQGQDQATDAGPVSRSGESEDSLEGAGRDQPAAWDSNVPGEESGALSTPVQKLQGEVDAKIAGGTPGAKSAPTRCKNCGPKNKESKTQERNTLQTLNVMEAFNFVDSSETEAPIQPSAQSSQKLRSKRTQVLDQLVEAIVGELHDIGSERRHRQLLDICQQNGLDDLARQALLATRKRLASESAQGPLEKPGAYYQAILLALLEDQQVFVPAVGEEKPQDVRRLVRVSLGL